jgi:hypothetical protein
MHRNILIRKNGLCKEESLATSLLDERRRPSCNPLTSGGVSQQIPLIDSSEKLQLEIARMEREILSQTIDQVSESDKKRECKKRYREEEKKHEAKKVPILEEAIIFNQPSKPLQPPKPSQKKSMLEEVCESSESEEELD